MIRNIVLGLISLGALAFFYQTAFQSRGNEAFLGGSAVYRPASWETCHFVEVGPVPTAAYDFSFQVKRASDAPAAVRVAFDRQDERNYNFLELTGESLRVGRVEEDFESTLAVSPGVRFSPGETMDCCLKRRQRDIRVIVDEALALSASDETFHGGSIHVGSPNSSVDVPSARIQSVDDIYFADDFMRPSNELGEWDVVVGDWGVRSLDTPSLSANAFALEGHSSGRPAVAITGHSFWDCYTFRTAVAGPGCGSIGIVFYVHGPTEGGKLGNYHLFRWAPDSGVPATQSERQLIRYVKGGKTLLGEAAGGYRAGQWYTLEVRIYRQRIRAFIDEELVFDVTDPLAIGGKFGLYSECSTPGCVQKARFDDVSLQRNEDVLEDFSGPDPGNWVSYAGRWEVVGGHYGVRSSGPARSVTGMTDWKDYRIEADIEAGRAEWVGLVGAHLDESSYLLYRISSSGQQEMVRVSNGQMDILDRLDRLPEAWREGYNRLALAVRQGYAVAEANGETQLEAWAAQGLRGKAGLYAENAETARFDDVEVRFLSEKKSVLNVNPVFAQERSMANWAAAESDWIKAKTYADGAYFTDARVHRMEFHGDVEFALNVEKAESLQQTRMSIGTDDKAPEEGGHFVVQRKQRKESEPWSPAPSGASGQASQDGAEGDWTARLLLGDKELASKVLPAGITPSDVRFSRNGSLLVGYVNSEPVVLGETPSPATSHRIAYAHIGGTVDPKKARVFCSNAWCYPFRKATTDWRVAAGTWEVTNRWQCDPRWTFFSGHAARLACIWNKRRFAGDVCIDLATGVKMDRERGGRYEYARDINISICGDGRDLTSGYSFMFGGDRNQETCITRGEKRVATSHRRIPIDGNIHRRWFHLKVARQGTRLLYWIDDELALEYDDPDPLTGDQIALWTWNNGIMVAQVRITSPGQGAVEDPSRKVPAVPGCIYD